MDRRYRLLTPGPVQVPEEVLREMSEPMIHHRTPEFEEILVSVLARLKLVFQTQQPVFVHSATGSGAMESALVNTLSPGDKVLCVVSGKFGQRWAEVAKSFGMNVLTLDVTWGEAVRPQDVKSLLEKHSDIKAVLCQACETSTAVWHPIQELAQITKNLDKTILIVDAITAVGAADLPMDKWGLDVVIGGSQKAFMLPAGLSFVALSTKAWRFAQVARSPRYYWDLNEERKANQLRQTRFSSPVSLIRALDVSLQLLLDGGLEKNFEHYALLAKGLRAGVSQLGLTLFSNAPSPTVTAINTPSNIDSEKLRNRMEEHYDTTVMGGQDHLKGKILRIGHLGYVQAQDIIEAVEILGRALIDLGYPCDPQRAASEAKKVLS